MIHKVRIQNFRSLRDVDIELERFTVFVGANGSGKTSVLEAIHNAMRAATSDPQKVFAREQHGDWIYTRGGVGDLSIRCEMDSGAFSMEATPPLGYPPAPELIQKSHWLYRNRVSGTSLPAALDPDRGMVFLRLNAALMARPSRTRRTIHHGLITPEKG
jgi:energy-coupling factor transporter ATP-binding protein EcfA2